MAYKGIYSLFGLIIVISGHVLASSSSDRYSRLIGTRSSLGKDALVSDGGRGVTSKNTGRSMLSGVGSGSTRVTETCDLSPVTYTQKVMLDKIREYRALYVSLNITNQALLREILIFMERLVSR